MLPDLAALGGRVIAVSPQTPDASLSTAEKNGLAFDVLSDRGSRVAEAYGLAFPLPQALRDLSTRFGHPLPAVNGTDDWRLPIPGTFVIAPSGRMLLARADVDYRTRLEPAEALAALRAAVEPA
jgi:peroxiredoxin